MPNKARKQQNGEVGYKRPPKQFQFKKGKSGNPSGKRDATGSRVPDLRMLLQFALNARVRRGDRQELITHAAAGIEQLVAQFAAGDRHARRDLIVLAEKLGVELAADYAMQKVVTAALAAEDEAIIADFLRRHGVELGQNDHTDASPDAESHRKTADESSS